MNDIKIPGRRIGSGQPVFIIAEAGVNHNGDYRLACRLIDAALDSGADAVKFQTWITEKLVLKNAVLADYQRKNLGEKKSQYEMLKSLELSFPTFRRLKAYAKRRGILFLSTPDEEESADFLEEIGVPLFKIGSGEITNLPYLKHVGRKGRPIILSTGMSTLAEVKAAVRAIEKTRNRNLVLLHCVSNYPAQPPDCNLAAMATLHAEFGYPVGFSDHTQGQSVAVAAVAMGACVLEKHLTLDNRMKGPDHRASLNPTDFASLVRAMREAESAMGDGRKQPTASELKTKKVVQKTLVTARALRAGVMLRAKDIVLRRTSGGLPRSSLPLLLGRKTRRAVPAFVPIAFAQFE
jgi:N,N'-diacetyllegionaminate synthase